MIYCIDLDGTLIKYDMSVVSFVRTIKKKPWYIFPVMYWFMKGRRALVKSELAKIYKYDVNELPYNFGLISYLEELSKDETNEIYLVSGSNEKIVSKIASHFDFFRCGYGSSSQINLTGLNKLDFIIQKWGNNKVCYAGNSNVDLKVWPGCAEAIVVSDDDSFIEKAKSCCKVIKVYKNVWPK